MADTDLEGAVGGPAENVQKFQNANDVRDDLPLDVDIQNVPANVRNTNINVKLGDDRNLTFNTLLTLCVSAMSNDLKMNVVQLIVMKFSDNEIVDVKDIMCKNSKIYCYHRGVCRISQGGGPNFKISVILDIHAAKRHVASSEAASLC